ncbi:MAG: hypothetical protein J7L66_01640 [Anaerolineaceae bacterium]|nr:hypothetical protein [Anaerolineaceae bacterium]
MGFLGDLGLILLAMVSYSIGRVLPARKQSISVELYDGGIITALMIFLLFKSSALSWLTYPLLTISVMLIGAVTTFLTRASLPLLDNIETNRTENEDSFFSKLWGRWKAFAFRMGGFQGRLILLLFYFTILAPFGIINTLFRNPLNLKKPVGNSFWFPLGTTDTKINDARRQF